MDQLRALKERLKQRAKNSHFLPASGEMGMGRYDSHGTVLLEIAEDIEAVLEQPPTCAEVLRKSLEKVSGSAGFRLRAMMFLEDTTTLNDRAITRLRDFPETGKMMVQLKDGLKHYTGSGADFDAALQAAFVMYDARVTSDGRPGE